MLSISSFAPYARTQPQASQQQRLSQTPRSPVGFSAAASGKGTPGANIAKAVAGMLLAPFELILGRGGQAPVHGTWRDDLREEGVIGMATQAATVGCAVGAMGLGLAYSHLRGRPLNGGSCELPNETTPLWMPFIYISHGINCLLTVTRFPFVTARKALEQA
jgi:hypothetical protein